MGSAIQGTRRYNFQPLTPTLSVTDRQTDKRQYYDRLTKTIGCCCDSTTILRSAKTHYRVIYVFLKLLTEIAAPRRVNKNVQALL